MAILTAAGFTFAVFCSDRPLHTDYCSFYVPLEGWNPESAPGIEPGPPAHMSEHASERPTIQSTELARQTTFFDEIDCVLFGHIVVGSILFHL